MRGLQKLNVNSNTTTMLMLRSINGNDTAIALPRARQGQVKILCNEQTIYKKLNLKKKRLLLKYPPTI